MNYYYWSIHFWTSWSTIGKRKSNQSILFHSRPIDLIFNELSYYDFSDDVVLCTTQYIQEWNVMWSVSSFCWRPIKQIKKRILKYPMSDVVYVSDGKDLPTLKFLMPLILGSFEMMPLNFLTSLLDDFQPFDWS